MKQMRVYRYWAEPMTDRDRQLLADQLRRASWYRKDLDRIEDRSRVLRRALLSLTVEERRPYQARIQEAERVVRKQVRDRARTPDGEMLPVAWGTCLRVEDAHDHSQRTTSIMGDVSGYVSPHEGVLAVQYQRHESEPKWRPTLASSLVGGGDSWVQIGAEMIGRPTLRSGRTEGARSLRELKFRIGTSLREPIWARLYTLIDGHHRGRTGPPRLPDGRVVWVQIACRRVGLRSRWSLIVVVDEACVGRPDAQRAAAVGIDIGWRKLPCGGIRIAYWQGSDGNEGELVIQEDVHRRRSKRDSLRSIRDRERDATGASLLAWIREFAAVDHPVRVAVQQAHAWKRVARWAGLLEMWRRNRIPDDAAPFEQLERWMSHDRHLLAWEAHNDRRMRSQIADLVDQFAVTLARRYAVICMESRGMVPDLTRRKDGQSTEKKWQRGLNAKRVAIVAPGAVRSALERMAGKYGAEYREVNPMGTTDRCDRCGQLRGIEDKAPLVLTCPHCGWAEDQDRTAASNLVRTGLASPLAPMDSHAKPRKMGTRRTRRRVADGPLATEGASRGGDKIL